MTVAGRGPRDLSWWAAWILVCVPAGALAGWGFVEFLPEYPEGGYDGGFMGDLVFFGSLLALGQAPFVGIFALFLFGATGKPLWQGYILAAGAAVAWALAGAFGWISGSAVSAFLPIRYSPVEPSLIYVVGETVRWLVLGAVESIVLVTAAMIVTSGSATNGASDPRSRWPGRVAIFGVCVLWGLVSALGGFMFELVVAESAVGASRFGSGLYDAVVGSLESLGVAANVAGTVVPYALLIPILYGIPTGFVFLAIRRAFREERR